MFRVEGLVLRFWVQVLGLRVQVLSVAVPTHPKPLTQTL